MLDNNLVLLRTELLKVIICKWIFKQPELPALTAQAGKSQQVRLAYF